MRLAPWLFLTACSFDPKVAGDAVVDPDGGSSSVLPDPQVFPGGGVGSGPIVTGLHVYAIDENTDAPIADATVAIGAITGTTDATGLFTTTDASIAGKQTILITATGYRPQLWVGVNGQNVTIQLRPTAAPPSGKVSGTITGYPTFGVSAQHTKRATISYTEHDNASEAVNNIPTGNENECATGPGSPAPCDFSVNTRIGPVALFAPIVDAIGNSQSVITYAYKTGLIVDANAQLADQDLTVIPPGELVTVGVNFGTAPAGLSTVFGFLEIELPVEGHAILTTTFPTFQAKMPPLTLFPDGSYRLLGLALSQDQRSISAPIRRNQTTTTIDVGTWLAPPTNVVASRTQVSWTPSTASIHLVDLKTDTTSFFSVVILDDTTTIDIPVELPALPLDAVIEGVGSTIDVENFGFDADRAKLTDFAFRIGSID